MATRRTIKIKNYSNIFEEYTAAGAIIPGMLIELIAAGTVQAHGTASGSALPMFPLEDEFQGKTINDAYSAGDIIPQVWIPGRGDQVFALLDDGENVIKGDFLESAGNGFLQKYSSDASNNADAVDMRIVGVALEAVNLSSSSDTWPTADRRILIRVK
jgi:hypothetical protein